MLTPMKGKVIIKFDPVEEKAHGLFLPDEDYIKMCGRCLKRMEQLDGPCVGRDIEELDEIHDRYVWRGMDYSHEIEVVKQNTGMPGLHPATVEVSSHKDFSRGDRVLVNFASGESLPPDDPLSLTRIVTAGENGEIVCKLEEE